MGIFERDLHFPCTSVLSSFTDGIRGADRKTKDMVIAKLKAAEETAIRLGAGSFHKHTLYLLEDLIDDPAGVKSFTAWLIGLLRTDAAIPASEILGEPNQRGSSEAIEPLLNAAIANKSGRLRANVALALISIDAAKNQQERWIPYVKQWLLEYRKSRLADLDKDPYPTFRRTPVNCGGCSSPEFLREDPVEQDLRDALNAMGCKEKIQLPNYFEE